MRAGAGSAFERTPVPALLLLPLIKFGPTVRYLSTGGGGDPREQCVAGERTNMKREDISKIFPDATEEQITSLLNINGADIQNAKGSLETIKKQLEDAQAENGRLKDGPTVEKLQAEQLRANSLQKELEALKQENSLRLIREKVAGDKKIPAALLTAETEEACISQADAILAFANSGNYPAVKDGGEPAPSAGSGENAAWLSLANQI